MNKKKTVSVIIPLFNEEEGLQSLFEALEFLYEGLCQFNLDFEVVFVDNFSADKTWAVVKDFSQNQKRFKVKAIQHKRNLGMQQSIVSGLNVATGDALSVLQSDLQDPPEVLIQMIKFWNSGQKFVVSKITKRNDSFLTRFFSWFFYRTLKVMSKNRVVLDSSDFYVFDREIFNQISTQFGPRPFVRTTLSEHFKPSVIVEYERLSRVQGNSSFNFSSKFFFALDGLLRDVGNLVKIVAVSSVLIGGVSLLAAVILVILYAFGYRSPVPGWATFMVLGLLNISITTFLFSLVLEIVSRISKDLSMKESGNIKEFVSNF